MKITLDQYPGLVQNIETLGAVDLSDTDADMLIDLARLLHRARTNVKRAYDVQRKRQARDAARYEREHGDPPF